jgi:lipopolysaccharide export system protein LptA
MATILIIGIMAFPLQTDAQTEMFPNLVDTPNTVLNIKSDKLLSDRNSQYILFSGNVVAVYGDKTIYADKLKVLYNGAPANQTGLNEGKINKIIATGNVKIMFENKTGYCDQAVYAQDTQTIILTGKDARIQSDDNYITGEKITIRQISGQVIVDGNPESRVNAVFHPANKTPETGNQQGDDTQK